ncbi:MAG: hypothetical protein ACLFSR_03715 [Halomonas sp.]
MMWHGGGYAAALGLVTVRVESPGLMTLSAAVTEPRTLLPGVWDVVPLAPGVTIAPQVHAALVPYALSCAQGLRMPRATIQADDSAPLEAWVSAWRRFTIHPGTPLALLVAQQVARP